ncbi:uncharacterized protein LOC115987651 [Quercus lobata]|uniref:uncharacterized protein LOC115987651 n=1 Tax=Quercus lobata TaxID=97700 RepID=UPI0012493C40|nr:uncharacterized protein LOC115987651 [Quercus lobata]
MNHNLFRSIQNFGRYRDSFLRGTIIQERFVNLGDLKDTFIPSCFEGRGWDKLLSDLPVVCEPLIREFYANAVIREDELSRWVRRKEFTIDAHDIDEVLGLEGLKDSDFTNYKDRMLSIETVQTRIGGQREGRCLNTTAFPTDMRCLTTIMIFNLHPVRKLTTINNARAIFLMELKEKTFIDISSHIFDTIVDETKTTSRPKLIFPSLLMRLFREKGVEIPQDISPMPTPSAINKLTIIRIQVHLPSDEEVGDQDEGGQMETETMTVGQASTPRSHGKRSRASTSLEVPPDAFQIILERIDGRREVQNDHTDRMTALQDQLNILSAKFDSFST